MLNLANFVCGASGANNILANGHYTQKTCNYNRKEVESRDCGQGFRITDSLSGGTGSGLGTLSMKIIDNHADRITATFFVYLTPYSAALSIHQVLENRDVNDNKALYNISQNIPKQQPKGVELNWVISLVMMVMTALLRSRFSGKFNGVNVILFPRSDLFAIAQAPLFAPADQS